MTILMTDYRITSLLQIIENVVFQDLDLMRRYLDI